LRTLRKLASLVLIALVHPACGNSDPPPKPPPTLATAPTTLVATPATSGRIDLTWIDTSDNEAEFRVERSDDGGTNFSQIAALPEGTQAFSDLGLLPNRSYVYRVTASNVVGNSPYAGPANATTKSLIWKSTIGGPGIRADHSAVYDSLGKRMILFGGQDDFFTFFNDVWSLNLNPTTAAMTTPPVDHWSPLTPAPTGTPPSVRWGHCAVYDAQNNRMIVFGGQDDSVPASAAYKNDVHILTLGANPAWSQPAIAGVSPPPRVGSTAVYDAANQRMIVFGGNNASGEKDDAYFLSLPASPPFAWSFVPLGPIKRTEHSAAYDGLRQQMVIFGGLDHFQFFDGSDLNAETWFLKLSGSPTWSPQSFLGTPMFRQGHSAVYDAANQRMVMFGGDTTFGPTQTANSELWSLRLDSASTWMFLNPTSGSTPAARYGHSAVYDSGAQRMIIYGGYDSSPFPAFPSVGPPDPNTWVIDF
jgi:hypothetical protein